MAAGVLLALVAFSGLAGLVAAAILPKPAWTLFGFEVVVTVSAVLGLGFARSGCRDAPAIGLACIGGCIGAASVLGYLSVQGILGGLSLTPFVAGRCGATLAIGGLALIAAMRGDRRSWTTLFKGGLVGLPALAGAALLILPVGRPVLSAVSNLGGFAAFVIGTVAFLALTASAAAGAHLVIRSFQTAGQGDRGSAA
jgi:hypothetical protein